MRAIGDLAAGYTGVMVSLGSKLGLYKAMAGAGPLSAKEVAARAGCAERYVREWLNAQAAGGYVGYHACERHLRALARAGDGAGRRGQPRLHPARLERAGVDVVRRGQGARRLSHRPGRGLGRARRRACPAAWPRSTATATARASCRSGCRRWTAWWQQLEAGIDVADVGCGHGHSTLLMAAGLSELALPRLRHARRVDRRRRGATHSAAGVAAGSNFALARAVDYPDRRYGLICFFDILHDLGDPVAAARHAAEVLAPGGTVMLVEPFAHDRVEDNLVAGGRSSTTPHPRLICCAHAISEGGALVLGAQAGQARLAEVFRKAGFTHFRRAAETPFNLIFEVRP